jgi:hypothetical protein
MLIGRRNGVSRGLLLVVFLLPGALEARAADKPTAEEIQAERFVRAKHAAEHSQFHIARTLMAQFSNASIGDRRKEEAEKILKNSFVGEATQLAQAGFADEASSVWLEYAAWLKDGVEAAAARKSAGDVLRHGFDAAVKARDFDQALDFAQAYAHSFPDDAPLCTPEHANEMRIERLVAGGAKRLAADLMEANLEDAIQHGVTDSALLAKGVNSGVIRQAYAHWLMDEGQLTRAIDLVGKWMITVEAPAERTKYELILRKALVNCAEAWVGFGNAEMAEQAVNALAANPATASADVLKISALKRKLATIKAGVGREAHVLKFDMPPTGPGTWQGDGGTFSAEGKIDLNKATIAVAPGFVLNGGSIFVGGGSTLELHGTAERPVIFRKVKLSADLNGSVKAQFAIFEDCTFSKGGAWFAYYNSKWIFSDCLLIRSNWKALSGMDYGLRVTGCIFDQCKLPQRYIGDDKVEDKARKYRDNWNQVDHNFFDHCDIAPSFAWCTNLCAFADCTVTGWDTYRSVNELRVNMTVPSSTDRFCELLQQRTQNEAQGVVRFVKMGGGAVLPVSRKLAPLYRLTGSMPAE